MIVPAFTTLGGGLPFLVTKPYFPDSVRWVHLGEVKTSNFLLEAVVCLIWGKSQPTHLRVESEAGLERSWLPRIASFIAVRGWLKFQSRSHGREAFLHLQLESHCFANGLHGHIVGHHFRRKRSNAFFPSHPNRTPE